MGLQHIKYTLVFKWNDAENKNLHVENMGLDQVLKNKLYLELSYFISENTFHI